MKYERLTHQKYDENIDSAEAKKNFKEWVKEFLSSTMRVKPSDVWTLDLIAETIAMKYDMDMDVILENK